MHPSGGTMPSKGSRRTKNPPRREDFPDSATGFQKGFSPGSRSRGSPLIHPARNYSRPLAWSYSSDAQMNGPTPLQSFSMTGSEM